MSMIEENRSSSFYVFTETNVFTFLRQYSLDWCIFACHEKSQMPTFKLSNVVQRLATHQSHGKNLFIVVVSQYLEKEVDGGVFWQKFYWSGKRLKWMLHAFIDSKLYKNTLPNIRGSFHDHQNTSDFPLLVYIRTVSKRLFVNKYDQSR